MAIAEPAGSRAQFLARLQQFMDMTLKDLARASEAKDADEREIQAIRSVLLKILGVWKEATVNSENSSPGTSMAIETAKKSPDSES